MALMLALFVGRHWYDTASQGNPELGISFSCRQVEYLGGDCQSAYSSLLDDLHPRHVRLSLYWSDVEPAPGTYDFAQMDSFIAQAAAHNADVLLTIGIKGQRYPEAFLPRWLLNGKVAPDDAVLDALPGVREALLIYVDAAVAHFGGEPGLAAWQVENEPFIKNFDELHGWTITPQTVAAEAASVHRSDGGRHPVVVTHSSWTVYDRSWKDALALGDVLGQNVFTKKAWVADWWYFFPYEMGFWVPDLPRQAAAAHHAGKQLWITELQAEPEEKHALPFLSGRSVRSISPSLLASNVSLARRSGASRVYLWGAEWWYFERSQHGDSTLWEAAAMLLKAQK